MDSMQTMINCYTAPRSMSYGKWGASACQAAVSTGHGHYYAYQVPKLTWQLIEDCTVLPYGGWNESILADEDLVSDINLYLQELGNNITAQKIVEFLAQLEVKEKHGITKSISERTAHHYLNTLGYQWKTPKKEQYADGYECADVVWYHDHKFLPQWREIMKTWTTDNVPEIIPQTSHCVVAWFYDESIFYAHDQCRKIWTHLKSRMQKEMAHH